MSGVERSTRNHYKGITGRSYAHPVVRAFAVPKVNWITSTINLNNKEVLEVGAGNGYISSHLENRCNLTALDNSQEQLDRNPVKKKVVGSAYELPFADRTFDVVICSNLLHHLDEPQKALEEMKRVAKEYVVISEPNNLNVLLFLGSLCIRRERNGTMYSKKYVATLIENAGLKIINHTYIGGFVMPNITPKILLPIAFCKSKSPLSFFQIFVSQTQRG
jgi:ubiquinone/menaquinone biosynthesis C-methylase UbiE